MPTTRFAHRCAGLLIGAFLAGCSGASQLTPSNPMQQSIVRSGLNTDAGYAKPDNSPLSGEVFSASNVTVTTKLCERRRRGFASVSFSSNGKTRGPYQGSFAAHGSWSWKETIFGGSWNFFEKFKVTSGTHTVFGKIGGSGSAPPLPPFVTCTTFGPVPKRGTLMYHSQIDGIHYSGPATVRIIESGSLGEMLRR